MKRAFVQFVMDPIIKMANAIMEGNSETIDKMIEVVGLKVTQEDRALVGKHLLKAILSKWISAADTILEMMVVHLPSPRQA